MSKVYGLKHATGLMKIQHMNMMMDFKSNLADRKNNPLDRDQALLEIHRRMGGDFHSWYNKVYELRNSGEQKKYERAIFRKLHNLRKKG